MWTLRKRLDATNSKPGEAINDVRVTPATSRATQSRSSRGQSLLEMALVLPMFLMLVCAVVDFSHVFYVEMTLQNAVRQAGRFATTGNHLADPNNPGQNLSRVNSIMRPLNRRRRASTLLNAINISSVAGGAGSAGGPGDIVTISVSTSVPMLTPIMAPVFQAQRRLQLYGERYL